MAKRGLDGIELISIHAPPRGATSDAINDIKAERISIHAPPRGATRQFLEIPAYFFNFNSRPSARGDTNRVLVNTLSIISIHAPPRGATCFRNTHIMYCSDFNSRPSARGDTILVLGFQRVTPFQFTPLREGRQLIFE